MRGSQTKLPLNLVARERSQLVAEISRRAHRRMKTRQNAVYSSTIRQQVLRGIALFADVRLQKSGLCDRTTGDLQFKERGFRSFSRRCMLLLTLGILRFQIRVALRRIALFYAKNFSD